MHTSRHIGKEIGTAFAVLAIYLLTVLTPLHQARAAQLDFEKLGYATLDTSWALCGTPLTPGDTSTPSKCPVAGVAKQAVTLPTALVAILPVGRIAILEGIVALRPAPAPAAFDPSTPPRAPPELA